MRTGLHMTIQDYFQNANIKRFRTDQPHAGRKMSSTDPDKFSHLLDTAQALLDHPVQNLSIREYFKNPVRTQRMSQPISKANQQPAKPTSPVGSQPPQHPEDGLSFPDASSERDFFIEGTENDKQIIQASIHKAARKYQLSPALLQAVIKAESNYQVRAVSPAGAQGLMQLMPTTAEELGVEDPFNIRQNIDGGAQYLRNMLTRFHGDLKKALSAYNAGPGTVSKYNGQVPYPETRSYVARVLRYTNEFSDLDQQSS